MLCVKIFFELVHASYGLPEGQAVKPPFFAPWIDKKMSSCLFKFSHLRLTSALECFSTISLS